MGIRRFRHARCDGCRLHVETCVCARLPRISTETEVVVVSHHKERNRFSSTAPLLERMLVQASWHIHDPRAAKVLVWPSDRRVIALWPTGPVLTMEQVHADPRGLTLVVPDGSWPQARRLKQRHPALSALPVFQLPDGRSTRFRLRTAPPFAERLCTLEAVARALGIIEGHAVEAALLRGLDLVVRATLRARGLPLPADLQALG